MNPTKKTIRFLRTVRAAWSFFTALFMGFSIHVALFTDESASVYIATTLAMCAMTYATTLDIRWHVLVRELSEASVEVRR